MDLNFVVRTDWEGSSVTVKVLEESHSAACLLDADLRIVYCNPAWDQFALANQGEQAQSRFVIGSRITDFIPLGLMPFYERVFAEARRAVVEFNYLCPSPELSRGFRVQVMPLRPEGGFAMIHSLQVEERSLCAPSANPAAHYVHTNGFVRLCSHCRRACRVDDAGQWDWVPAYLSQTRIKVTHGLCPVCLEYFYHPLNRFSAPTPMQGNDR